MSSTTRLALLDINELAEQLGISVATIYRWRSEGQDMPHAMKIGGRVRWTQDSVDSWLAEQLEVSA